METNFKIMENVYYNEYGQEKRKYYFILRKHTGILGVEYWRKIVHPSYDSYETTTFETREDAVNFVKNVLCKNKTISGWKTNVVDEISCNN